jgi:hypothetical protein
VTLRRAPKPRLNPKHSTPEADMPACVGNPKMKHVGRQPPPVTLRGFDDKWRCEQCHQIHVEIVFKEAGALGPDGIDSPRPFKVAQRDPLREQKLREIRADYSPGGRSYERSAFREDGYMVNAENVREASALAKKMRSKGEDTRDDRVVKAYRAMVAKRNTPRSASR